MAMLLSGVMCMPAVFADTTLGTVSDVTNKDTLHEEGKNVTATITPNGTSKNVTITYSGVSVKALDNSVENRPDGYAWIGVKVVHDNGSKDKGQVKVTVFDENTNAYKTYSWESVKTAADSENNYYLGINSAKLKGAMASGEYNNKLTYVLEFDWDGNKTVDQTVTVIIDPADVTLYDKDNTTEDWDNNTYQEVLDDLTAEDPTTPDENTLTDNNTSNVTVNKKANLDDVPKTGVVYSVINYLE